MMNVRESVKDGGLPATLSSLKLPTTVIDARDLPSGAYFGEALLGKHILFMAISFADSIFVLSKTFSPLMTRIGSAIGAGPFMP